jgi:hypothetical protein
VGSRPSPGTSIPLFTVRGVEAAAEKRFGWNEEMFSGALCEVTLERTVQFGSNRHAARVAAFALEETGSESDMGADSAVVQHVPDGEREDFGGCASRGKFVA